MIGGTQQMIDLLRIIRDGIRERGRAPSFEAMRLALGVASKTRIFDLVNALEERGYIVLTRYHGCSRIQSIQLSDDARAQFGLCPPNSAEQLSDWFRLPGSFSRETPRQLRRVSLRGIKLSHSTSHAAAHAAGVSLADGASGMSRAGEGSHSKART